MLERVLGFFRRKRTPAKKEPELDSMNPAEYFAGDEAWVPIDSSNVHSLAFYGQGSYGILRARFKDESGALTGEYEYQGVHVEAYQHVLAGGPQGSGPEGNSDSQGGRFYHGIREKYHGTRIW